MSILTPPMATNRLTQNPGSCVLFLPFTDGSGNIHTDQISGFTVTDDGTAGWTVPHSSTTNCTGALTSGSLPSTGNRNIILMDCLVIDTSSSLCTTQIGAANKIIMSAGGSVSNDAGGSAAQANFQVLTAGQICFRLITFNNTTGLLNTYSKVGAAAAQADNTDTDLTAVWDKVFAASMTIGGNATFVPEYYGIAMYSVSSLPSDAEILSAIEKTYTAWTNGVKTLPSEFASL